MKVLTIYSAGLPEDFVMIAVDDEEADVVITLYESNEDVVLRFPKPQYATWVKEGRYRLQEPKMHTIIFIRTSTIAQLYVSDYGEV